MLLLWCAPPSPQYNAEYVSGRRFFAEMVVYFAPTFALMTFQHCTGGEGGLVIKTSSYGVWSFILHLPVSKQ